MTYAFSAVRTLVWLLIFSLSMLLLPKFKPLDEMGFLDWFILGSIGVISSFIITWAIFEVVKREDRAGR